LAQTVLFYEAGKTALARRRHTMFAQLLITIAVTWIVAELLCRWLLGVSAHRYLMNILSGDQPADAESEHADLENLLRTRLAELQSARERLRLARSTADVTDNLTQVENELGEVERRLTELEKSRPRS
jgi:hypothetical protein